MDLGFTLVRDNWRAIYLPWFILLTCLSTISFIIIPDGYKEYAVMLVWWLKPFHDRFLLNSFSHQLFNKNLTTEQALKSIPELIKKTGLPGALTFRRPSFSRGFTLPVWQLEQLRGKNRSKRQKVLLQSAHSHAIALTLAMIFIELALYFSIYALIILMLPSSFQSNALVLFFTDAISEDISMWLHILDHIIYTLALFLVEPFYVAASFTLYINRRTQLEAWDIELIFKQFAQRLKTIPLKRSHNLSLAFLLPGIVIFIFTITSTGLVYAKDNNKDVLSDYRLPAEKSAQIITEIMQDNDLSNEKITHRWTTIEEEKEPDTSWNLEAFFKPFIQFISVLFEAILWITLLLALISAFLSREKWLPFFQRKRQSPTKSYTPDIMFGMDIRPQSLPDDIPETARKLWQKNKHRDSLSLLYRGALAQLVNTYQLALKDSQTEGDILLLAKTTLERNQQAYLEHLTKQWKLIAYAHHLPKEIDVNKLYKGWYSDFLNISSSHVKGQTDEK